MNKIKKQFAEYFITDSKDFLLRYCTLEESATNIGLKTKLVVELMFSLECALKSLFIIESHLTEKDIYKKIKKFSHNIDKIVKNLSEESVNIFNKKVTINYNIYEIFYRYNYESQMAFRSENGTLNEIFYEIINDPTWRKSFYGQIQNFIKYVESKNPIELKITTFININTVEEKNKICELKSLNKKKD